MRTLSLEVLIFLLLLCSASHAQIYRWRDGTGTVHFTDNLHAVPPEYRDQLDSLDDRLPPPPQPQFIPLEHDRRGYIVQARVNGQMSVRLVVDTGATASVLAPHVAHGLGLPIRRDPLVVIHTANGTAEAGWTQIDELEVGGRRSGPLRLVIHDAVPGADGLLGMDFLSAYRVEIRAQGPHLLLSPP